jgi:plasmid stability protein
VAASVERPFRIQVALAPALAHALSVLATREDRTAEAQARRLLEEGLIREGVLQPPQSERPSPEPVR